MKIKQVAFQNLADSNRPYIKELEEAALKVIESGWYLKGKETEQLETELARSCGARYAVAVSNGLDALRLMIRAQMDLGRISAGDEVLVPANTYIASVLPLTEFGLNPILVEPSERDFNIDFQNVRNKVTRRTRAIMNVHLYGNPSWDEEVMGEFADAGMIIMEDNAQGIGAKACGKGLNGNSVTGNLGHCAAFSFYPSKNIGALGDAGAVTTNDDELAAHIRVLGNYGTSQRYYNEYTGYNCRMDELQAAMLRVKLRYIDTENDRRRKMASLYDRLIENPGIKKPEIMTNCRQIWHQYVVRTPHREALQRYLAEKGIGTLVHYPVPPHLQKCYRGRWEAESLPITEQLANEVLSLPIANVTPEEVAYVSDAINNF